MLGFLFGFSVALNLIFIFVFSFSSKFSEIKKNIKLLREYDIIDDFDEFYVGDSIIRSKKGDVNNE